MIGALQQAVVQALRTAAADDRQAEPDPEAPLAPTTVKAYEQELLNMKRLLPPMPALMVELARGALERMGDTAQWDGQDRVDVILAASTAAGADALMHEGARLTAWAIEALKALEVVVGGRVVCPERIFWKRLATDKEGTTWTATLTCEFSTIS